MSEVPLYGRKHRGDMRGFLRIRYRITSLIRNTHPPRITIGPEA